MPPLSLAIVNEDAAFVCRLSTYFTQQPTIAVVLVAESAEAFLSQLDAASAPQVVLLGSGRPDTGGAAALPLLKAKCPSMEVILLTDQHEWEPLHRALQGGATGYLAQSTPLTQLKDAVEDVAQGGVPLSPAAARSIMGHFRTLRAQASTLTRRERHVLQGLLEGLSDKQLAARHALTTPTIRTYVKKLFKKLQVTSRAQLVFFHVRTHAQYPAPPSGRSTPRSVDR
ncbi:MAG: hypothetical protein JWP58_3127 [Hymenobacter sp.]|nr:hypothetical protein [Hymenobacter sp.]